MSDKMREALELARKRIEYLGHFGNARHEAANERDFFPIIDAALAEPADTVSKETWMATVRECNEAKEEVRGLREAALSRPVSGEPVAFEWRDRRSPFADTPWSYVDYHDGLRIKEHPEKYEVRPLYAAPPGAAGRDAIAKLLWDAAPMRDIMDAEALADAVLALGPTVTPQDGLVIITDAMCEAAIDADKPNQIQGFSYEKRHVIRNFDLPHDREEIWSAPVAGPKEYEAFQRRCKIERMRLVLSAALALPRAERGGDQ